MDEPTASLDVERRVALLELLKELKKDKLIILITHNMYEAQYFDRIYTVKEGEIFNYTIDELKNNEILVNG
ncbi:Energy-coupling factor transporter ATP-binding protein EcfA2 [compost metagenome]